MTRGNPKINLAPPECMYLTEEICCQSYAKMMCKRQGQCEWTPARPLLGRLGGSPTLAAAGPSPSSSPPPAAAGGRRRLAPGGRRRWRGLFLPPASQGWRGPNMRGGAADLEATALASTAAAVGPASGHGRLLRRLAWIGRRRDAVFGGMSSGFRSAAASRAWWTAWRHPWQICSGRCSQWWWSSSSSAVAGQKLGDRISRSII